MECNVAHSEVSVHRNYLTPLEITEHLVAMGTYKVNMPIWKTLLGSFFAGSYVTFGGILALITAGGLSPSFRADYPSVPKMIVGCTFWIALILILTFGGDLFTGNITYAFLAWLNNRITFKQLLLNGVLVFFGNWATCAFNGYFFAYLGDLLGDDPYNSYLIGLAKHKLELKWGQIVIRGIAANWMVCCAVCFAVASQDQLSRIVSCFIPVFLFATTGYEHCVANMFFVTLAFNYSEHVGTYTYGQFIAYNLIPATIGNYIGGPLVCGGGLFLLYQYEHMYESHENKITQAEQKLEDELLITHQKSEVGATSDEDALQILYPSCQFSRKFIKKTGETVTVELVCTIELGPGDIPVRALFKVSLMPLDHEGFFTVLWDGESEVENSNIEYSDVGFCDMLGFSKTELLGKKLVTLFYSSKSDQFNSPTKLLKNAVNRFFGRGISGKSDLMRSSRSGRSAVRPDVRSTKEAALEALKQRSSKSAAAELMDFRNKDDRASYALAALNSDSNKSGSSKNSDDVRPEGKNGSTSGLSLDGIDVV